MRAFYTGWYKELVTALPEVKDGMIAPPPGPGLGLDLLPDLTARKDAVVRSSVARLMLELVSSAAAVGRTAGDRWRGTPSSTGSGGAEPVSLFRAWDGHSDDPNRHACYPLVPWSNRISGGGIDAGGRFWPLQPNWQGAPYPIHGDGWQRPWRWSRQHAGAKLRLTLDSRAQPPFDYRAELTYALAGTALTHAADGRAPRRVAGSLRPGLSPLVPAHTRSRCEPGRRPIWLETADHMPAGKVPIAARPDWDFARWRPLPTDWINNGFSGWNGTARVRWPEHGLQLSVEATPELGTCILYSPNEDAPFFCLEPVSHPVDAFHLPGLPGLRLLQPGERFEVACTFIAANAID